MNQLWSRSRSKSWNYLMCCCLNWNISYIYPHRCTWCPPATFCESPKLTIRVLKAGGAHLLRGCASAYFAPCGCIWSICCLKWDGKPSWRLFINDKRSNVHSLLGWRVRFSADNSTLSFKKFAHLKLTSILGFRRHCKHIGDIIKALKIFDAKFESLFI